MVTVVERPRFIPGARTTLVFGFVCAATGILGLFLRQPVLSLGSLALIPLTLLIAIASGLFRLRTGPGKGGWCKGAGVSASVLGGLSVMGQAAT